MAITNESNFPNSRITAQLQAVNTDDTTKIMNIEGQEVTIGSHLYKTLMVQIAQAAGSTLVTDANINQYQGMTSFNLSNAFIPEGYDDIIVARTPTQDEYKHYASSSYVASILITYTDTSKNDISRVQRYINPAP